MRKRKKRSLFERVTGTMRMDEFDDELEEEESENDLNDNDPTGRLPDMENEEEGLGQIEEIGQLSVDVINQPDKIIIKAMVAGVKPHELDVQISRDMVVITGTREEESEINEADYYHKELYWGSFSRNIILPEEIDVDLSTAQEKYGMMEIHLPKIDKNKKTQLQVKSL